MTIEYLPNTGFIYNSSKIEWNDERNSIREIFKNKHRNEDKTFKIAEFFEGDESMNIHQKKDIYENLNSNSDMICLNYDQQNKLTELEIHFGYDILVENIRLEFGKEITGFINQFEENGFEFSQIESGNYILPKLKITIANDEAMGGIGNGLSYFYAGTEISHLTE